MNRAGVWHAAYTAGVVLPRPAATARYWHRSLDVKKLVEVGFTGLPPRQTLARAVRLHKLAERPATPGLRPMVAADAEQVGTGHGWVARGMDRCHGAWMGVCRACNLGREAWAGPPKRGASPLRAAPPTPHHHHRLATQSYLGIGPAELLPCPLRPGPRVHAR